MSSELPSLTFADVARALQHLGFQGRKGGKGSHYVFSKSGHPYVVTVPDHGHSPIKKGLLRGIIRGAGVTVQQFVAALA